MKLYCDWCGKPITKQDNNIASIYDSEKQEGKSGHFACSVDEKYVEKEKE